MKTKGIIASLKPKKYEDYKTKLEQQPGNSKYTAGAFSRLSKRFRIISKEERYQLELRNLYKSKSYRRYSTTLLVRSFLQVITKPF